MSEADKTEFEIQMNRLFWKLMKFLGIPMIGVIVGGVVFWASMNDHVSDGHPETVKDLVHAQEVRSKSIETKVDGLVKTVDRLEKKIDNYSTNKVTFQ